MNLKSLLASLLLFPICLFAGISGNYTVSGFDPTLNANYTGTAVITSAPATVGTGTVYTIVWTYTDFPTIIGTGVRKGCYLSFVYTEEVTGITPFGTQLYKIDGNKLKGPWILFGDTRIGLETLKKV